MNPTRSAGAGLSNSVTTSFRTSPQRPRRALGLVAGWLWNSPGLAGHVLPRCTAGGPATGEGAPARSGASLACPSSGSGVALRGAGNGRGRTRCRVRPAAAGAAAVLPGRRVQGGRRRRRLQVALLNFILAISRFHSLGNGPRNGVVLSYGYHVSLIRGGSTGAPGRQIRDIYISCLETYIVQLA